MPEPKAQHPQRLSVLVLGVPQLLFGERPSDALRRKNRALVYYLAAHAQPLTREQVLIFFWPDHDHAAAQQILRTMLFDLRKILGEALVVDDETLALSAETYVDARTFEAHLPRFNSVQSDLSTANFQVPTSNLQSLASNLQLYRGDFLAGFALPDAPSFDDWVAAERERYRLLAIRGFSQLAQLHENQHDYPQALEMLTRALTFDPLQEDLQRAAMRLHYLNGDRAGAVRRYESLRKMLDDEMGVPPMPETRRLYDAIITDTFATDQRTSPQATQVRVVPRPTSIAPLLPFTGRVAEMQQFNTLASSGKMILIEGEPGIGKTRLAEEFIAALGKSHRKPLVLLSGVAHELEQGLPYQPVMDALRGLFVQPQWSSMRAKLDLAPMWIGEVARLVPELLNEFPHSAPAAQPADEARMWEGLSQFLASLARQQSVVLWLDDLHWADASTIGWLGYVLHRTPLPSLLIIGTTRPIDAQSKLMSLIQALHRVDRLAHFPLPPLSAQEVLAIAGRLSPAHGESLAQWLMRNSEGNSFFATELVRYAYGAGVLEKDGTLDLGALSAAPIIPPTIQNLIQARLMHLSEQARRVVRVAAVVGREFDFELVRRAAELDETPALDVFDELRAAALIQPRTGERFAFDHSLTMDVAYRDMGETRYRAIHRRVAETLAALHASNLDAAAGLIAFHFAQGNAPERAAPFAWRAGGRAASLAAWAEAIRFYRQALETEAGSVHRAEIFVALGQAHFHAGEFAQATDAYRAGVELAQAQGDLPVLEAAHLALNLSLIPQARFVEAIALAEELRRAGPPELAVCAELIWGTALSIESAQPVQAERHLREAERLLAQPTPFTSRITLAHIKYQLAGAVGQQGRSAEAVALYREALNTLRENEQALDLLRQIMLYNGLAYHLHLLGDSSAEDYVRAGIHLAREKGSLSHLPYLLSTSGEIALAHSDLDAAEKYFDEGLALAQRIPVPERIAGLTANLGLVARARGQRTLAIERLTEALARADELGAGHLAVRIRIWLAPLLPSNAARGRLAEARQITTANGFQSLLEEVAQIEAQIEP